MYNGTLSNPASGVHFLRTAQSESDVFLNSPLRISTRRKQEVDLLRDLRLEL
jgi:hypothetical protein